MKISKILLVLFVSISVLSCKKDDDGDNSFLLSSANLAGTYSISSLNADTTITTVLAGIPISVVTNSVGSVFQIDIIFSDAGTYTVNGQYLLTSTTTGDGQTTTNSEIIVLDETGSYQIDANAQTITFDGNSSLGSGALSISEFTQTQVRMMQSISESNNGITVESVTDILLVRQ